MTMWHKRALILTAIWIVLGSGFMVAGLSAEGPSTLVEDSPRRNVAAAMVASGILANALVRFLTRKREDWTVPKVDERDEMILQKSSEISLGVTTAIAFIGCLSLNEYFEDLGSIPVTWVWFLAWSIPVVSHLSQSLTATIMYSGVFDRG